MIYPSSIPAHSGLGQAVRRTLKRLSGTITVRRPIVVLATTADGCASLRKTGDGWCSLDVRPVESRDELIATAS